MTEDLSPNAGGHGADAVRRAVIDAALGAYEDAGLSGLCAEGRWEAAIDAMRSVEVEPRDAVAQLSRSVVGLVAAVGDASAAPPGGGSVAASAGALAAALTRMVAGLTSGRPKYAHVAAEMQHAADRASRLAAELTALVTRDATAFASVAAAYKLPRGTEEEASTRAAAIQRAMMAATDSPLEIARAAADVAELGAAVAERGNTNAVADAAVAVLLAEAVCRAAALTVRVNTPALPDHHVRLRLTDNAAALTDRAARAVARAVAAAERAL